MALVPVGTSSSSENFIKFGPVGSLLGNSWDVQMGSNELVQIFMSFNHHAICSLQFQYCKNRNLVVSEKHGGNGGSNYNAIKFDYPREYITSVSGTRTLGTTSCISSITFATNLRTFGPFGNTLTSSFEFQLGDARQFYGFFGTADSNYIRSIGVYMNPLSTQLNMKMYG